MSALAVATGSINLGQGFPDYPGPPEVLDVARAAIGTAADQYPPGPGIPELRRGDRGAPAALRRADLRPRHRGAGHRRRHRGAGRGAARAAGHRRRGRAVRADVRLLRRRHRHGRWRRPARSAPPAGRRRRAVDVRPGRAAGRDHPAHQAAAAQHPAQPHRQGVHPRRAGPARRATPSTHDLLVLTDEVYEHLVFSGARAPVDRHPARDAGAHARRQQRGQDLQRHRLEDRLDLRAGPAGRRRPHRQAVPDLRQRRAVPARRRRRARPARRVLHARRPRPRVPARRAGRRACGPRASR